METFAFSPRYFALIGFIFRQFEISRLVGIRPYNAIVFLVLLLYLSLYSSSILSDNRLGSLLEFRCRGNFPLPSLPPGLFIIGRSIPSI